jgi:hypothetical protein
MESEVADALDAWFVQLQGKVKKKSFFAVPLKKTQQNRSRRAWLPAYSRVGLQRRLRVRLMH